MSNASKKTCCICGKTFMGYGNNPWPVKEHGECCDDCNANSVVPARLERLNRSSDDKR